nr:hypothetical protein CFP56_28574 [Quercus suber]
MREELEVLVSRAVGAAGNVTFFCALLALLAWAVEKICETLCVGRRRKSSTGALYGEEEFFLVGKGHPGKFPGFSRGSGSQFPGVTRGGENLPLFDSRGGQR